MAPDKRPSFATLPPELLDQIINFVPTARTLANLSRTNKALHEFVEKDGWRLFARARFPSLCPPTIQSAHDATRTLVTLSRAWDKYAFVAQYVLPAQDITSYPGRVRRNEWSRPRTQQTIGFTPQLDVYEDVAGLDWYRRHERLAFSAGAELCLRHSFRSKGRERHCWQTYRALSAREGLDDITTLHLVRPDSGALDCKQNVIIGTARGDLQLLHLPTPSRHNPDEYHSSEGHPREDHSHEVSITYFTTQGAPIRGSTLYQREWQKPLLVANLGDERINLYGIDGQSPKIAPSSVLNLEHKTTTNSTRSTNCRIWCSKFLSASNLAVGLGTSVEPIHIYSITESGFANDPIRRFSLGSKLEASRLDTPSSGPRSSSVYAIAPLVQGPNRGSEGQVFVSGAYDGVVRLHDLRSPRDVEKMFYGQMTDDSAIYSLLPRGNETIIAGSSRHSLLKVFDLRRGAIHSTHLDGAPSFNLFLRPSSHAHVGRPNHRQPNLTGTRNIRADGSSVYSLASAGADSPFMYAGLQNVVMSLTSTELSDRHQDPLAEILPSQQPRHQRGTDDYVNHRYAGAQGDSIVDLAMVDVKGEMLFQETDLHALAAKRESEQPADSRRLAHDERWIKPRHRRQMRTNSSHHS